MAKKEYTAQEASRIQARYAEIIGEISVKREAFATLTPFDQAEWMPKIAIEGGVYAAMINGKNAYFSAGTNLSNARDFKRKFGLNANAPRALRQMELSIKERAIIHFNDITRDFNAVRGQGSRLSEIRINSAPKLKVII